MMKEWNIDVAKTLMISALISIMALTIIHRMVLQPIFQFVPKSNRESLEEGSSGSVSVL
jgi:hypothetical protein